MTHFKQQIFPLVDGISSTEKREKKDAENLYFLFYFLVLSRVFFYVQK